MSHQQLKYQYFGIARVRTLNQQGPIVLNGHITTYTSSMWYFFPPLFQKASILVALVKKSFFCKNKCRCKNVSPCGRVMSPFGQAMSPLQNHIFGIIWNISKNAVPQKKKTFSIKRQTFSTILKMQVWTIYVYIHMGCKPLNKWDAPASR